MVHSNVSIVLSSVGGVFGVLVDLMFFLICFMCTFAVTMEGSRCFIKYTFKLGHVVKWTFLMDQSKIFLKGLNCVAWSTHLSRACFLLPGH